MSFSDQKITAADIASHGVQSQPDKLLGTAAQNKAAFDALITEVVKEKLNGLIDALLSASAAGEIGVDTDKPGPYREAVARRVLTEAELSLVASDAGRFLRLWTRKEAVLKLLGCGLARSMNDLSVWEDHICADGRDIYLSSILWDGWWISAASEKEEALCCRRVDAEDCLPSADTTH